MDVLLYSLKIEEEVLPKGLGGLINLCCYFGFAVNRLCLFYGL